MDEETTRPPMLLMSNPRYPTAQVELRSTHPLALVSAVRQALRRSGVDSGEIHRFNEAAFESYNDPQQLWQLCRQWAKVKAPFPEA
jgi:hypothetical protein